MSYNQFLEKLQKHFYIGSIVWFFLMCYGDYINDKSFEYISTFFFFLNSFVTFYIINLLIKNK